MSKSTARDTRQLRAIGHKLKPVVTVAGKGLTDTLLAELDQALERHELIKVKLAVGDRTARSAITAELCARSGATLVQSIGNVILLLRRAKRPDAKLSNLIRPL